MVDDRVVFVSLKGRGDGQIRCRVSVKNVHQLGLFHGGDHDSPPFGVRREILAGDDSPCTGLAKRLLVQLDEAARLGVIVQNNDTPGIGAYYRIV